MARLRLSQAAVAEQAGMSTSTLSRRLAGESDFTVGEIYRLAEALDIAPAALLPQSTDPLAS